MEIQIENLDLKQFWHNNVNRTLLDKELINNTIDPDLAVEERKDNKDTISPLHKVVDKDNHSKIGGSKHDEDDVAVEPVPMHVG